MKQKPDIQLQYEGFLNTPILWKSNQIEDLVQFEIPPTTLVPFQESIPIKMRLGKLVERFVSHELNQYDSINILIENLQVIENKITIGELDCLLKNENELIHLEIVYKFYLYDPNHCIQETGRWIGPNRKDSLIQKLTKLKEKQLPILFHKQTKLELEKLEINLSEIIQKTYFKAQLFVPYSKKISLLPEINNDCIKGVYIQKNQLNDFNSHTFYIPSKMNWIIEANNNVNWMTFIDFLTELKGLLNNEKSPLCWVKDSKGNIKKIFVVWW